MKKQHLSEGQKEIIEHAITGISEILLGDIEDPQNVYPPEELHDRLFNEDYFIVGYYAAEQFLIRWGGVFNAVGEVKDYDEARFGELYTDLSSSEAVANMLAYADGEKFLHQCPTFSRALDRGRTLSEQDLHDIVDELQSL
jgi:hypothetical protein